MIRAFLALPVPGAVGDALLDAQEDRMDVHWTPFDNFHLTLVFLGDVEEPVLDDLHEALSAFTATAFAVGIAGVGAFGTTRPRLLYAGVAPCEPLMRLQARLERVCERVGIVVEARKFAPHITLGRPRRGAAVGGWIEHWAGLRAGTLPADEIVLYRSDLGRGTAVYTPLARYPLTGRMDE